jgi:quercetin dioxygenase-like cupin family protein
VAANAQGANAPTDLHHAHHAVQAVVEGGNKSSQEANASLIMSKLLPDVPGKEVVMITVTYPPGSSGPVHKHDAHAFIYVLEGSVVMGVNDGEPVTLAPGQVFYEGTNDIHTIGRNASKTRPAKFLVFLIKDNTAPISVPVK